MFVCVCVYVFVLVCVCVYIYKNNRFYLLYSILNMIILFYFYSQIYIFI